MRNVARFASAARLSTGIELHGAGVLGAAGREQSQGVRRERARLIPLAEHVDQLVDAAGTLERSDPHARLAAAFGARGKRTRKQARKRRRGRGHRNLADETLDGARIEPAPEIGRKGTLALAATGALPDDWRRCLKVRTPILGGRPRRRLRRRKVLIAGRRRLRPKVLIRRWRCGWNAKVLIGLRRRFARQHGKLAPLDLRQGFAANDRTPPAEDGSSQSEPGKETPTRSAP